MKFGRLSVVRYAGIKNHRHLWLCKCDCGSERTVRGNSLRDGNTRSCGCLNRESYPNRGPDPLPGRRKGGRITKEYRTWCAMKDRCSNPQTPCYKNYGSRGITVCDRWMKFENFLEDMGERPAGTTLDRINNNGNYEPGNCRWATMKEQNRNRGNNRLITVNGETRCISEWAEKCGVSDTLIGARLRRGVPEYLAIRPPKRLINGVWHAV